MKKLFSIFIGILIIFSCENDEETQPNTTSGNNTGNAGSPDTLGSSPPDTLGSSFPNWLIPISEVIDGGPGKDGIPALASPLNFNDGSYLQDEEELVIGFFDGNNAVAYPHQILDWHEIINVEKNGFRYAITYCPLTGTGIGWSRTLENGAALSTFGVSGLLYNNNLIPYDRGTDSNWSQMRNDCVNGSLQGEQIVTFSVVETTWSTWKAMYPDTQVISTITGYARPYGQYPYGDYKTNNGFLLFPLNPDDNRLPRKERVHGIIIDGKVKVYRFSAFNSENKIIADTFLGNELVIIGNTDKNIIVSFFAQLEDGTFPVFTVIDEGSAILSDTEGNKWDVFGYAIEGPRTGQRLITTKSYMGYWFSWGAFYPVPDIYE